jgi:hypothetical protein
MAKRLSCGPLQLCCDESIVAESANPRSAKKKRPPSLGVKAGALRYRTAPLRKAQGRAGCHLAIILSRQAMTSSSARTASMTGITGRASMVNAGSIEQNL